MSLRKKLNILLVVLLIFMSVASAAYGAVLCSLTVKLSDDDGNAVSGINIEIFQVAQKNGSTFTIDNTFRHAGVTADEITSGNGAVAALKLQQYVFSHGLSGKHNTTDSLGKADFHSLEQGIYLVMERGNQEVAFSPYLVMLPNMMGALHQYVVTSEPKISETDTLAIRVTVRWVDNNDAYQKRPDGVIVQLLQENPPAAVRMLRASAVQKLTAISKDMNWTYVFTGLNKDKVYNLLQLPVSGYETTYSGNMYEGFVITNIMEVSDPGPWYPEDPDNPVNPDDPDAPDNPDNPDNPPGDDPSDEEYWDEPYEPDKPKIPQTGAVLWPVFMLLAAGVLLVIAGAADLMRGRKS